MKAFAKRMRVLLVAGAVALVCAATPLVSQALGGRAELTASAAGNTVQAYTIKNVTKNKTLNVDEKNFERVADYIVYYDSVWGATHDGKASPSQWGTEVKVERNADDKFVVTEIKVNQQEGLVIPAKGEGYVLSGNGVGATALQEFELNDEIEFTDTSEFITINQTRGLEVLLNDRNVGPDQGNCATVWKYAPYRTTTASASWRNRIVCEKAEGENLYKVKEKQDQSGDTVATTIPVDGIVIDTHGNEYMSYGNSFYYGTQVDDIIYFVDKNPTIALTAPGITVKSGDLELAADGLNPTLEHEFEGRTLIYTNASDAYKTLDRTDETVKEYTVEKDGDDWKVTAVAEEGQTVIPDYDGFILSIPSTVTGYDTLAVGDTVTLEGKFEQKTAFAADVTENKRVFIDGANVKRGENQLILYDDVSFLCPEAQGDIVPEVGYTATNEWGVELKVEWKEDQEKYVVTKKTNLGEAANLQIPEKGFILSGNGTARLALDDFKEGDEILVYDRDIASNTKLTSITVDGAMLEPFDPETHDYDITVYDTDGAAPEIGYTVQTRMGQTPTVKVNGIETALGTVTIEVTAPDGSVGTYTLKFDRAYGQNRNLTSVTVGGVALKEINTNMTYTVKPGDALPEVKATAEDPRAQVTVTQATAETMMATILVVADDTSLSKTYKITFVEANTSLSSITIGGVALEGFSADKFSYTYTLAAGTQEAPAVAATAADSKATVSVEPAESVTGTATITVSVDGIASTYTVQFQVAAGGNAGGDNGNNDGNNDGNNGGNNGGGNNTGMIVGIVVGVVAAVAVAAGVTVFVVMKKKRGQNK